jgi:hypothetical protein
MGKIMDPQKPTLQLVIEAILWIIVCYLYLF